MILALVFGLAASAQEGLPLADEPGTLEATLASGLRVTLVGDPDLTLCAVVHHVEAGAAYEEPGEEGAAHFVEHLLFAGTERTPDGALWDLLDSLGARANGTTSHDATLYEATLPPEGLVELLAVEADRFSGVGWGPEAVQRERSVILDELRLRDGTEPMARLGAKLRTDLYLDHPYARPTGGTAEQVAGLDIATLEAFQERWYRAGNMHLVVVGPHDPMALLGEVEDLYTDLPTGRTERSLPEVDLQDMPLTVRVRERGVQLGLTGYAWPLPPLRSCGEGTQGPCTESWWTDRLVLALLEHQGVGALSAAVSARAGTRIPATVDWWQGEAGGHVMIMARSPSSGAVALQNFGALLATLLGVPSRLAVHATPGMVRRTVEDSYRAWIDEEGLERLQARVLRAELERSWFARERALAIAHSATTGGGDLQARVTGARSVTEEDLQRRFRALIAEAEGVRLHVH